jgi:hypothetical protein
MARRRVKSSYDNHRDLDEVRPPRTLAWVVFQMPGAVLMWIQYMFPARGNVLVSARRRGNPIVEVFYTLVLYVPNRHSLHPAG